MIADTILCGDALERLRELPDACVQTCVTSPPYWGLRDYGVAGQLGLEATPDEWVARMVEVFRQVRRVLRDDGTLWINCGDAYASAWPCDRRNIIGNGSPDASMKRTSRLTGDLKNKDLIGLPWMLAFALRADGWYLRADIIWHKPNPMPESVRDRPTKAHEYLFLLSKRERYYYDAEAIREPIQESSLERGYTYVGRPESSPKMLQAGDDVRAKANWRVNGYVPAGRNKRSVWTVATAPFSGAKLVADYVGADGRPYKVSPDCPVHGQSRGSRTWRTAGYGEQPDRLSPRTPDNDGSHDPAHAGEYSPIPSRETRDSDRDTSREQTAGSTSESRTAGASGAGTQTHPGSTGTSPGRDNSQGYADLWSAQPASQHSSETSRTAPVPATSSACTASARTARRTPDTSASRESNEPSGHTLASNISRADSPARPLAQRSRRSGRTSSSSACLNGSTAQCTCQIITVDHFATFPPALIEPCILAGTSPRACEHCGAPWRRVIESTFEPQADVRDPRKLAKRSNKGMDARNGWGDTPRGTVSHVHQGWAPTCRCQHNTGMGRSLVLDPFMGAGTTAVVARRHSRHYLGIELNPAYIALAEQRIANEIQPVLWSIA